MTRSCRLRFMSFALGILASIAALAPMASSQVENSANTADLDAYTTCNFFDGLAVVSLDPLAPGVTSRSVDTFKGPRQIEMLAGYRVMFAYPGKDFYANVKVERLPAKSFPDLKLALIDNFDHILASSPESQRNYGQKPRLNGFDIRGLDRLKLEGGVLGIYLLFDDETHIATTIYLLNQEPGSRNFQTIEEYARLRTRFLDVYTGCISQRLTKLH